MLVIPIAAAFASFALYLHLLMWVCQHAVDSTNRFTYSLEETALLHAC